MKSTTPFGRASRGNDDDPKKGPNQFCLGKHSGGIAICSFCNKRFSGVLDLVAHIKGHIAKKPFVCDYPGCRKTFRRARRLLPHYQRYHQEKPKNYETTPNLDLPSPPTASGTVVPASFTVPLKPAAQQITDQPLPSYFYTRMLPLPDKVAQNIAAVAEIQTFPPSAPQRSKDVSDPLMGTFSSSLWVGNEHDV